MAQQTNTKAITEALSSKAALSRFVEKAGGDEAFAKRFQSELLTTITTNKALQNCNDTNSIWTAAYQAAALKLSVAPSLGYAYIVPYKGAATFQLGYKGLTQLAMRTGLYRKIRSVEVYEGELRDYNRLTGDFSFGERTSDKVVGYLAYFELLNGFQSMLYISREDMEAHATKYSQSYKYDKQKGYSSSVWSTNFDAMGRKTVLKQLLSKYAPLSVEMQEAIQSDQAKITKDGTFDYIDNRRGFEGVDTETGEVIDFAEGEILQTDSTDASVETATTGDDMPKIDFD